MNTTYTMQHGMSVAPLCIVPFSLTDFVYNPSCYMNTGVELLKEVARIYIKFNLLLLKLLIHFMDKYAIGVAVGIGIGLGCFWLVKCTLCDESEEPLSELETELVECIRLNASTGCTTQMLYEHMNGAFTDNPVRLSDVKTALLRLKNKGYILSAQATLWLVSGN